MAVPFGKGWSCGRRQVVEGVPLKDGCWVSPFHFHLLLQSEFYILGEGFASIMTSCSLCVAGFIFLTLSQGFYVCVQEEWYPVTTCYFLYWSLELGNGVGELFFLKVCTQFGIVLN